MNQRIGSGDSNFSFRNFMGFDSPQFGQKGLLNQMFQEFLNENDMIES